MGIGGKKLLTEWVKLRGWKDKVEKDEDGGWKVATSISIGEVTYNFIVEAHDKISCVDVFIYPPYTAKPSRRAEMLELINDLNGRTMQGRFWLSSDGHIQYHHRVDFEGLSPSAESVDLMASPAFERFESFGEVFTAVALTKTSAKEAIKTLK